MGIPPASEVDDLEDGEAPALGGRVVAEYSVVWSATYHVPMLWFRAWDESESRMVAWCLTTAGTPLPLKMIVGVLMRGVEAGEGDDAVLLPNQPFPLLQVAEHPVTGELGWAVHPCEVGGAVSEIIEHEGGQGDGQVRWLETWFMLSDSVVDLSRI